MRSKIEEIFEMFNDPKKGAKIKLIGGFLLVIALVVYFNLTSSNSMITPINEVKQQIDNSTQTEEVKEVDNELKNNYAYDTKVSYVLSEKEYQYRFYGQVLDNNRTINKVTDIEEKFEFRNGHYYKIDTLETLTTKEEIYEPIDYVYISKEMILEYINIGSIDYETTYSDGSSIVSYKVKLSDLITGYLEEKYIIITINKKTEEITIDIDYTNLMNYYDKNITSYKVNIVVNEINKIAQLTK